MIVFKTFLKVLNKCKVPIIIYSVMLVFFGGFNMTSSDNSINFVETKPKIFVVNNDKEEGITKDLINFLKEKNDFVLLEDEESISDALFYRQINYCIYIPKNFNENFMKGQNPKIEVKTTGEYSSFLAEVNLEKYLKLANIYRKEFSDENDIIKKINETLEEKVDVEVTSSLDSSKISKATFFFNFINYCILAGAIYVICLILSSFKNEQVYKRTIVSSMNLKSFNRKLLLSNSLFAFGLWFFYIILSIILLGDVMFSIHGLVFMLNSFVFTIVSVTIAFLIGNLIRSKEAVNGIVNVVALGSSFLCGAFVPMEWLPNSVLNMAHVLPSYYFIKNNELLKTLEVVNLETLKPVLINIAILLMFSLSFVVITNIVTKHRRKIG